MQGKPENDSNIELSCLISLGFRTFFPSSKIISLLDSEASNMTVMSTITQLPREIKSSLSAMQSIGTRYFVSTTQHTTCDEIKILLIHAERLISWCLVANMRAIQTRTLIGMEESSEYSMPTSFIWGLHHAHQIPRRSNSCGCVGLDGILTMAIAKDGKHADYREWALYLMKTKLLSDFSIQALSSEALT